MLRFHSLRDILYFKASFIMAGKGEMFVMLNRWLASTNCLVMKTICIFLDFWIVQIFWDCSKVHVLLYECKHEMLLMGPLLVCNAQHHGYLDILSRPKIMNTRLLSNFVFLYAMSLFPIILLRLKLQIKSLGQSTPIWTLTQI